MSYFRVTDFWMSQQRDVKDNGCQRQWMSKAMDVKGNGCQSQEIQEMSQPRDVTAMGCQGKAVKAKGCQSKGMSKQGCQSKEMSEERDVKAKSFVFTSQTRTKASFSHLDLLDFEGNLARKLRFHNFNSWNLKQVSHESFVFTSSTVEI